MNSILNEIVAKNRAALELKNREIPLDELAATAADAPERADFAEAFRAPGIHVIAELKKASPSKGMIRETLDVPALAAELKDAGAAALSVLTEPFYFKGGLDNLRLASETVSIPLLKKGAVSNAVKNAQALLIHHGYTCGGRIIAGYENPDGEFGPATVKAVKDFQALRKLEADGEIGTDTWTALLTT